MKKILIGLSLLAIVSLTGCGEGHVQPDFGNTEDYKLPNISRIVSQWSSGGYNYLLDEDTGVVYLEYDGAYRHAITVMFDEYGKVMTKEDIKKD